jgi:hypothetical protein
MAFPALKGGAPPPKKTPGLYQISLKKDTIMIIYIEITQGHDVAWRGIRWRGGR